MTRRAAEIMAFGRPDADNRRKLLGPRLHELGFDDVDIDAIVDATGPRDGMPGFTYSDLAQRLIPAMVLDAYPEQPITATRGLMLAQEMVATPPFMDKRSKR